MWRIKMTNNYAVYLEPCLLSSSNKIITLCTIVLVKSHEACWIPWQRHRNFILPNLGYIFVFPPSKQKPLVKGPFHRLVLWSGTNFHMTSGVHSQKPHSSTPSKPICMSCLLHLLQVEYPGLAISFVPPPPPLPHFLSFLISVVGCCTVVGCLRVICCRRCCCPVLRSTIVKRFESKLDGAL